MIINNITVLIILKLMLMVDNFFLVLMFQVCSITTEYSSEITYSQTTYICSSHE